METTIGNWEISIKRVWPTTQRLTDMYNTVAPVWHHRMQRLGCCRTYSDLFRQLSRDCLLDHIQDHGWVLDCGVGTGAFSLAFTSAVQSRPHVFGVDLSDEMVQKARSHLGHDDVEALIHQGDVRELPYAVNTFDLVMSAHMVEHMPDPTIGLREMVRVLRPGAPMVLSVTRSGLAGILMQLRWGNGSFRPEILNQMLADAGLKDIRCYSFPFGWLRWISFACVGFKA